MHENPASPPSYRPPAPDHEPHRILIHKGAFTDATRYGRTVPYKIYTPTAHALPRLPVVLWSHGLGGSRDGAAFLARFVASHGYVVVNIQHPGTDSSLWEGKPGHPWDVIRRTRIPRRATLDRFRDVPFVLDSLPALAAERPEIGEHMDLDAVGLSGHSFGALTTQVMAGQMFPDEDGTLVRLREARLRAGILYSFVPMGHLSDAAMETLFGPMDLPLFFMTGTKDDSPIEAFDYTRRLTVYDHAGSADKHLLILEDGDHMVFAGSRGQLAAHPLRKRHEEIIKIASLAYWDAMLRGDAGARDWLENGGFTAWLDGGGTYERGTP